MAFKHTVASVLTIVGIASVPMESQTAAAAGPQTRAPHSFAVQGGHFTLDGSPFRIISGEMHYPRVPRAYWRDRFRMAKAMGLNTITTYVFWNEHEQKPGVYDFSDNNDVAEYIREAQEEGLYVILRPGPYVCAEWEFGGFPAWLLKDHGLVVRSGDPKFMAYVTRWFARLGQELAPLQIGNGGPIIAVQVENEYGSFESDHVYMEQIRQTLLKSGFTKALLYTADGPSKNLDRLKAGTLPDLPAAVNFGAGEARNAFEALDRFRPNGPFMAGEYWAGWFDHWGDKHAETNAKKEAEDIDWMLRKGYSVSIYMFHGGTSFGWMNGANSDGKNYQPDVTSYDYDAPLDESGRPNAKYNLFRYVIGKATGEAQPAIREPKPPIQIAEFPMQESVSLWSTLPSPVHSENPMSMEDLDQAYGYLLYRTQLNGPVSGDLVIEELHDYAQIYLDGKLAGSLDRREGQNHLRIEVTEPHARLDILVENTGRVNFTKVIRGERQGITRQVTLAGTALHGWDMYPLPMENPGKLEYASNDNCSGACFYRATFNVGSPGDTFLDTRFFKKGEVWLNGRALGRVWDVGPQVTLYVPGPWLRQGKNEVVVFDLKGGPNRKLTGRAEPILNGNNRASK
jgi:beta-galactosidase